MTDLLKIKQQVKKLEATIAWQLNQDEPNDGLIEACQVEINRLWTEYTNERLNRGDTVILVHGNVEHVMRSHDDFFYYMLEHAYDISYMGFEDGKIVLHS